jgi:Protein of unknown function (DUF3499)
VEVVGRLCERPGCSDVAAMAYGFDADRLLVWLAPRDPDADPLRAGGLCRRHADAMVVPQGWTLDDRREATPRLFRAAPPDAEGVDVAAEPSPRRRRTVPPGEQLRLEGQAAETAPETVADVAGPSASDDPDATHAIPWLPDVDDDDDDLGGVLSAESPLLARAFRGTDRPR